MLVFDLDDTLYLERDFAFSAYAHLDGWAEERLGVTGFGAAARRLFEGGERRRIFNAACAQFGIEATPDLIAELVAAYRFHPPQITLCPDADRYLANADRGAMGIITDGPERMQRAKISALGLERRIAHIRPTGAWPDGFGKPHPRAYEEMEGLAADPAQMVYVADNPAKDFITPKARGWRTVQIIRPGGVHDPVAPDEAHSAHVQIESFDQLDAALAGLAS